MIQTLRSSGVKAVQLNWNDGERDGEISVWLAVEIIEGTKDGIVVNGF